MTSWNGRGGGARRVVCAALLIAGGVAAHAAAPRVRQAKADEATYERMTGELRIRHARINADGHTTSALVPASLLHLERKRANGRWRTTLAIEAQEPLSVQTWHGSQTLDNPFAVVRFEYDDDGGPPRMYNRAGALIGPPGKASNKGFEWPRARDARSRIDAVLSGVGNPPPAMPDRGPGAGLVIRAADRDARRASLATRFRRAASRQSGLDRFIDQAGELSTEVLTDADTALPVEINVAQRGRLVAHSSFAYQALAGGELIRHQMRTERAVSETDDTRLVIQIDVSNVVLTGTGRR